MLLSGAFIGLTSTDNWLINYVGDFRAPGQLTSVTADHCCGYCVYWDGDGGS